MDDRNGRQEVGDYTVTPFPGGHLIGRLRAKADGGSGWEHLGNEFNEEAAMSRAWEMARQQKTAAAWMYESGGTYRRIQKAE